MDFFPGFCQQTIETSGTSINVVTGGSGPPLLLLHGYPQTHIEWRKMAPDLSANHTLVMPDLRGYGDSGKPPAGDNHINYSKRAMALDQVEVMEKLGFQRFAVVSHDRGARVAHRMALDHADRVTKLVMIDICPTHYMYQATDQAMASAYYHWFFMIQQAPYPETLIGRSVDEVLKYLMGTVMPHGVEPEAYAEYRRCFSNPVTIRGTCERPLRSICGMMKPTWTRRFPVQCWCSGARTALSARNTMSSRSGRSGRYAYPARPCRAGIGWRKNCPSSCWLKSKASWLPSGQHD
jgi:haloacetate dehalogenase